MGVVALSCNFEIVFLALLLWIGFNFFCLRALGTARLGASPRVLFALLAGNTLGFFFIKKFFLSSSEIKTFGGSFLYFQLISLIVDLYRGKIKSIPTATQFFLYLLYFPKFFLGPIERFGEFSRRAEHGSEESTRARFITISYFGALGAFKAFALAPETNRIITQVYGAAADIGTIPALVLIYLSALQVYCAFSGFTDIAWAISKLLGIELSRNFHFPFFAKNPQEFWRSWHITFTHWLRDYVFYPLAQVTRNFYFPMLLTFFLMGAWHGISWNFILCGLWSALGVAMYSLIKSVCEPFLVARSSGIRASFSILSRIINVNLLFFGLFLMATVSKEHFMYALKQLSLGKGNGLTLQLLLRLIFLFGTLLCVEYLIYRRGGDPMKLRKSELLLSFALIAYFSFLILFFNDVSAAKHTELLYFQF